MTLVKRPKAKEPVKTEPSDYEKIISEINKQSAEGKKLSERMDALIESDKALHDAMQKGEPVKETDKKEPEIKEPEPDTDDKKEELTEKIETA